MARVRFLLRWLVRIVLVLVAFAAGALAVLTLTERGRTSLAGIVSDLASTPDSSVRIAGLSGIWSGALRLDSVTLADTEGAWLVARGVEVDWSPLSLLSGTFDAERVFAQRIEVARAPAPAKGGDASGGGLPVALDIAAIDLPDIALGPALAGGVAGVSAKGTLRAEAAPVEIVADLDLSRTDGRAGRIAGHVRYLPDQNVLDVDVAGSEPQGGILANLMGLPGEPAVEVTVKGSGPAADWRGSGTFAIDGTIVTRVDGRHATAGAARSVEATGSGDFARFLPERFRPLFAGQTEFDLAGTLTDAGGIEIARGAIRSEALSGTAAGTINPAGATDFALELSAAGGGVPLSFGTSESPIDVNVASATVRAFGDGRRPALDVAASLPSFATNDTRLTGISLALHSDEFDLSARSGPITASLAADALVVANPTVAPLVAGRVSAELSGQLSTEALEVASGTVRSDGLDGTFDGRISLVDGSIQLGLRADVAASALPVAARPVLADRVAVSAELSRDDQGNVSAQSLSLASGGLSAEGSVRVTETTLDADLTGRIADAAQLSPAVTGTVDLALKASGDRNTPDLAATITAGRLSAAGRELTGLRLSATGKGDAANPVFGVDISGSLSGQPLQGTTTAVLTEGDRALRDLALSLGDNRITGTLALGEGFVPEGTLALDLANVAQLAAPSAQDLAAALRGTAVFARDAQGRPQIAIDMTGNAATGAVSVPDLSVQATVADYMAAPAVSAAIRTPTLMIGQTRLDGIDLALDPRAEGIGFSAAGRAFDAPLAAEGLVRTVEGGVAIDLASAEATVQGIAARLAAPATVINADGVTRFDGLTIDLGGGSAVVSGTAGETLDLNVRLTGIPASLLNDVAAGLDAAGTIGGTVTVTGTSAAPVAAYDLDWAGAETAQTRGAGLGPLAVAATGGFSDDTLTVDATANGASGFALTAGGTAKLQGTAVDADLSARLADVAALAPGASGALDLSLKATGDRAAPDLAATLTSDRLVAAGREITSLRLAATGKADLANPTAAVTLAGNVGGEALNGAATLTTAGGRRAIDDLLVTLGQNRIAGRLELDDGLVPLGEVTFDVPELGSLAALAFEQVTGALNGSARFLRENGSPRLVVDATVSNFARGEISGSDVALAATVDDYLAAPVVAGTVKAAAVRSGATIVSGIDVRLTRDGAWTGFDGGATVAGIPARASGRVQVADGTTVIELASGGATVQGLELALANPSTVRIADGSARLGGLSVALGSGSATVSGTAGSQLDLSVRLDGVPASLADRFVAGLGAAGTISGTATVTGQAANPSARYELRWSGASVAQTRDAGLGTLNVASDGQFAGGRLSFTATAGDASGLALRAGGSVDTASRSLSVDVSGPVPLAFLSPQLAAQGLALSGGATVDLTIRGGFASPSIGGSVRASGLRLIHAGTGIAVENLSADIALSGDTATLRSLSGTLSSGGSVSASGTVGIAPAQGFPANLSIRIADGRYTDGRLVTSTLSGDLAIRGPLASAPALTGTIDLGRTVVTIPDRLPSSLATLDVKHRNAPAAVRRQADELRPPSARGGSGGGMTLDVTVNAPNQIFIVGRGLDAELGGSLRLSGPAAAPQATGQFELERGRLSVIGRRLTFTRGTLTFSGSLIPYIDLVAESQAGDATVTVSVTGPADNPKFVFASVPMLPEDEVLARLIFGRSMSNLSPLQIAQLAEAAAQFAGVGGSNSLLNTLRGRLGVDDLDVKTTEDGGAAVSAGKYLNDRTYFSVEGGDGPGSVRARIDLDVGRGVKLRGEAAGDGEAKGGIFFERDY